MATSGFIALLHDLAITAGIYAIAGLEVSPATVIAVLTILGYSLYDTVVVFDKIKENVALPSSAKKTYGQIANESMNQVLMRSINTSLTTLLPVGSLLFIGSFLLGADTLRDLALALFVGIAAGTYSSIFVATPLLSIMKEREPRYAALRAARPARSLPDGAPPRERGPQRAPTPAAKEAAPKPSAKPAGGGEGRPATRAPRASVRMEDAESPNGEPGEGADGDPGSESPAAYGKPAPRAGGSPSVRVQPRRTNRSKRKKGRR